MKKLITAVLLCVAMTAYGQSPTITSWVFNTTGATGYNCSGCSPAHSGTIPSNIQSVYYTSTNAYITCAGVPSYNVGPWSHDPNVPTDQSWVFKITLSPATTGTFTATALGQIGVWLNGVTVYNPKDGYYWDTATSAFGSTVGVTALWNRNAYLYEASSFDACLGHADSRGSYHNHINPKCLYTDTDSTHHSPIIGFAFDGYPIYGAYGYANTDGTGGIKRMSSSYALTTATTRLYGPTMSAYVAGTFVEDYVYTSGSGDLDAHNGRFCVTPEYPSGTYAYFVTIDASLTPQYPFVIGPTFYGTVQSGNTGTGGHNTIPTGATLYSPNSILGTKTVCAGSTTTLSSSTSGGTWSSSATSVATVGSGTGVVSGVAAGTTTISYTTSGSTSTATVTVYATPSAISGATSVCVGSAVTVTDATSGGTWSGGSTTVATIGSGTGTITGVASGSTSITYSLSTGCSATAAITVNAAPSAISGSSGVCAGGTTTLTDSGSGVWSSGSTTVATVGSTTGTVTGVLAGTTNITYTLSTGCRATKVITVSASPSAITGTTTICAGSTTTLSNSLSGGVWSSGATGVATVGTGSGIVTGVSAGTAIISYTTSCGTAMTTVTVGTTATAGSISGATTVCIGSSISLTDGVSGGTWSSGSTSVAVVNTSGTVTGVSAGVATISYTVTSGCGSAVATFNVTVSASPSAGTLTGSSSVSVASTITLSSTVSGGTWSMTNGNATISTAGVVTGVTAGADTAIYSVSNSCSTVTATKAITINNAVAPITGVTTICAGTTTTLSDTTAGGTWSSGTTSVATVGSATGIVYGVAGGTSNITYTTSTGFAVTTVTINAAPQAITGTTSVCEGSTTTLVEVVSGGTWSSDNTSVATIGTSGVVTGVSAGSANITYILSSGCYQATSVSVSPVTAITGTASVCLGSSTTLSNASTGGTWSSSNTAVAVIGSATGIVSGIAAPATSLITYTPTSGCKATVVFTVNALPLSVSGSSGLCAGATITLSDATSGGTWSSSNTSVASVDASSGVVSGIAGGSATVTYTLSTGCVAVKAVTVNSLPSAISGTTSLCAGTSTTLTDAITGGTWASSNTSVAAIGSSTGTLVAVSNGSATITYTIGCGITNTVVTVGGAPTVTSVSPNVDTVGSTVVIGGTNFNVTPSSNIVYFGATMGTVTAATSTSLAVTVPAGATYQPVTVENTGCALTAYAQYPFLPTYNNSAYIPATISFNAKVDLTSGISPFSVAIGDIDGDGKADLVSANYGAATISVFRNTSTSGVITSGSFSAKLDFSAGASPYGVAIGDLDNDGKLDIVVTNKASSPPTVSVFRNTATSGTINSSSLAAKVNFAVGAGPISVAIGDLDMDGKADLAVANNGANTISVLRNTSGSGSITSSSFAAKVDLTAGSHPFGIAIGDIDGDGKPDIAVPNQAAATVSVFRNTSSAGSITSSSFAAKVDFTTGSQPYGVAIGDIDGDGKMDLAVPNNGAASVSVLRNTATSGSITTGSFAGKVDFTTGAGPYSVAMGDINGDGKADLAVANRTSNTVSILRNTATSGSIGSGSFAAKVDVSTGSAPVFVAVGDLDGDGIPDVTTANIAANTLSIIRNNPVLHPAAHSGNTNAPVTVCVGSAMMLGAPQPNGTWSSSDERIAMIDEESGLVTGMSAGRTMVNYTAGGDMYSTPVIVTPLPDAVIITAYPGTNIQQGQKIIFSAAVQNGGSSPVYQWYLNNASLTGETNATYTGDHFADNDVVSCTVGSSAGCGDHTVSANTVVHVQNGGSAAITAGDAVVIQPNPNKGSFYISGTLGVTDEVVHLEVTDLLGQAVYRNDIVAKSGAVNEQVQLSNVLANGMYLLNVRAGAANKVYQFAIQK
jgi:trimeric autotransporter adhesin